MIIAKTTIPALDNNCVSRDKLSIDFKQITTTFAKAVVEYHNAVEIAFTELGAWV